MEITDYDVLYFLLYYHKLSTTYHLKFWLDQYNQQSISHLYYLVYDAKIRISKTQYSHDPCVCNIDGTFVNKKEFYPKCSSKFKLKRLKFDVHKTSLFEGYNINKVILLKPKQKKEKVDYESLDIIQAKPLSYYVNKANITSLTDYLFLKLLKSKKKIFRNILPRRWRNPDRTLFDVNRENILLCLNRYESVNSQYNQGSSSYTVKFDKPKSINRIPVNVQDYIVQYCFTTPVFVIDKLGEFYHSYDLNGYAIKFNYKKYDIFKKYEIITILVTFVNDDLVVLDLFRIIDKNISSLSPKTRYDILYNEFENKLKIVQIVNPYETEVEYFNIIKKCSSSRLSYNGLLFKNIHNNTMFKYKFKNTLVHLFDLNTGKKMVMDKTNINKIKTNKFILIPNDSYKYKLNFLCRIKNKQSIFISLWDRFRFRDFAHLKIDTSTLKIPNFISTYVETSKGYKSMNCFIAKIYFNSISEDGIIQEIYDIVPLYPHIFNRITSIADIKRII